MAGSFPDAPGLRMLWDRDGSVLVRTSADFGTLQVVHNQAMRQSINSENPGTLYNETGTEQHRGHAIIFPEVRDVHGFYPGIDASGSVNAALTFQWSANTTNGVDGSWTGVSGVNRAGITKSAMRTAINSLSITGASGIRWVTTGGSLASAVHQRGMHVYGRATVATAPDRLRLWHPTLDQEIDGAHLDYGDVPQNTQINKTVRVKNPSSTLTAEDVVLSMEALTDTTPPNVAMYEFSLDGGDTWAASAVIGDLAPGAVTGQVLVRRSTPTGAVLSLWWTRVVLSAAVWS
jgi:hypothetical protein